MILEQISEEGRRIAPLIDHTLLKVDARAAQVLSACREAREYGFAAVCVMPRFSALAATELKGSRVRVASVAGFPHGASTSAAKAFEAAEAVLNGAGEVDMVMAVGALKDGDDDYVRNDIRAVVDAVGGVPVKVILETCLLTDSEKVRACLLCLEAGASFVKTSTGLAAGGATVEDVRLMRRTVGDRCGVKAAGGIRTLDDALRMVDAGANRIGTSAGVQIVCRAVSS